MNTIISTAPATASPQVPSPSPNSVMTNIISRLDSLTPKGQILGNYIMQNPTKAVFMTIKELAETCKTSEATVIRFIDSCGYKGYSEFQQALKAFLDTGLTLLDRADLQGIQKPGMNRLNHVVLEEMSNLQYLYETINIKSLNQIVEHLQESPSVYIAGSRLSYTFAYYMGWSLTRVRKGISIIKGSDTTTIDHIANAPKNSLVVMIATTRYPNELIKLAKFIRRESHNLIVITDNDTSPMLQFANFYLVVPMSSIPFIGNTSNMLCVIKYIVQELASRLGDDLKAHQQKLEQVYLENDILFNLQM
ncbi:Putative Transcriptional regulators [Desulfamplus magnetovallimortis]|uniref:Putative Transcriptional regulators n=1 Tax=Desulfamplus magnetovallimortis TaxID=1246637 RepID=A0A1W1HAD0_9BACT|nr:MurR/RpiR family transcriptional regulator [Desulfamplus magnetovallimortis]SLM29328.1 Putative Transcriptional regulators [Desulfamplus magnetovallimortis]